MNLNADQGNLMHESDSLPIFFKGIESCTGLSDLSYITLFKSTDHEISSLYFALTKTDVI
jgi:hypothetical protein